MDVKVERTDVTVEMTERNEPVRRPKPNLFIVRPHRALGDQIRREKDNHTKIKIEKDDRSVTGSDIVSQFRINNEASISQFLFSAPSVAKGGPGSKAFPYKVMPQQQALSACLEHAKAKCVEYGVKVMPAALARWRKH